MASMQDMLKQAQKLQEDMEVAQKKLETDEMEVSSGGGAVVFKLTGSNKFTSLKLSDELWNGDRATGEETILAAIREAVETARKVHEEEMKKITAGLKLPGMPE